MSGDQWCDKWWSELLEARSKQGRADADAGIYDPPFASDDDDPQNEDENGAYRRGFDARRRELGDKFQWRG